MLAASSLATTTLSLTLTASAILISWLLHRAFQSRLSRIPGPLICRFTSVWLWYHTFLGDECDAINELHHKYGPVIRIRPNDCVISDGKALAPIYSERGGFLKADNYSNFDFEGHSTIFSAINVEHRAKRSKAVTPLFSTSSIRAKHDLLNECSERFAARLKQEASNGQPVDLLSTCRRLGLESVCSYLFNRPYGSFEEKSEELSAAAFVDSAVSIGKFFLLPNWLFVIIEEVLQRLHPLSQSEQRRIGTIDSFGAELAAATNGDDGTYQARLKKVGLSDSEIAVQCKDLIFAGTDSSGTVLAKTCWWLCRKPEVYKKLKEEIAQADAGDPTFSYNLQSLPYLDAVIREGLRLGQANPTRFPRVVPKGGWKFTSSTGKSYFFPAATIVGCQSATLHFNPDVFVDPTDFKPERWLNNPSQEMQRDFVPFNLGARQCIARNMAQYELLLAFRMIARKGTLDGAQLVTKDIKVVQWFNSKTTTGRIEVSWNKVS